jgi:PEP-CTERM motif
MLNFKSLLSAAAVLPVVAAGLFASIGSAQAAFLGVSPTYSLGNFKANAITWGDKKFTFESSTSLIDHDEITIDAQGNDYYFNYVLKTAAPVGTPTTVPSFTLNYKVDVLPTSNYIITAVDNDSTVGGFNPPAESLVSTFYGVPGNVLTSTNGSANFQTLLPASKSVRVTNTYTSNGGNIVSFQNSFHQEPMKTPEPTTMLGLGVVAAGMTVARRRKSVTA